MRFRLLCVLFAACAATAVARVLPQIRVEVEPEARITKHVLIVLDRSGSMTGNPLRDALGVVRDFMSSPVDELQVGIMTFSDATERWPGRPEPDARPRPVPADWAAMPSEPAMRSANEWLGQHPASGGTNVAPAMQRALSEARRELTILLVSDGKFPDAQMNVMPALIAETQAERVRLGHGEAVVACYGIGSCSIETLASIARIGHGGYFRTVPDEQQSEPTLELVPPPPVQSMQRTGPW